ncbi:MAG: ROK family protein [Paludibacteraceae bacterium]|nr:ROK family protein [Paludibacteraceae bacterium]MBO7505889.1 ROK family protein [Paludibacteraceae bacterium]MBR3519046.1 ROK family protein [Paludibacteraceae bacterium]MBR5373663.1 ROK family protein [Paludibacteraceae bacterium]MCR5497045.1 ROK family protein [Paludibacteraceae bacterium]
MKSELKPNVVGIDIGGTNTVFGIVDANGNVLASNSIKTQAYPELEDYIEALGNGLLELISKNGGAEKINGIGVGAPNANYYTGNIEHAANLPWKGIVPFAKMLSDKVGLPVSLTNDANAAAIGEMKYGAARGMRDFIMITLGTGVGSGVVANGQLIYGHDGNAGELGHVIVRRDGRPCGCGNKGCLETYTSATGVARTAKEFLLNRKEDSLLRKIDLDKITSKDVFDAAMAGDQIAKDIFAFTGQVLGEALADFVKFSSPEAFVLFGGLAKAGDLLFNPVKKAMDDNLMPVFKGKVKVLFSQMKDADAAVLGASALAWDI